MSNSPGLDELLEALEPPYRSRGEAQVGRLLDRYGIPFLYEQPTLVYDRELYRRWHPDFTLPEFNSLIVEYAGMPDVPNYMAGIRHKLRVFAANELPAMFVYPQDLTGPAWPERLYARIIEAGEQALQPRCVRRPTYSALDGLY